MSDQSTNSIKQKAISYSKTGLKLRRSIPNGI